MSVIVCGLLAATSNVVVQGQCNISKRDLKAARLTYALNECNRTSTQIAS